MSALCRPRLTALALAATISLLIVGPAPPVYAYHGAGLTCSSNIYFSSVVTLNPQGYTSGYFNFATAPYVQSTGYVSSSAGYYGLYLTTDAYLSDAQSIDVYLSNSSNSNSETLGGYVNLNYFATNSTTCPS